MTDEELIKDIMGEENDEDGIATDEYDYPASIRPKANELLAAIETIHNYWLFIGNRNKVQKHLRRINCIIQTYLHESLKQTTIDDYFCTRS